MQGKIGSIEVGAIACRIEDVIANSTAFFKVCSGTENFGVSLGHQIVVDCRESISNRRLHELYDVDSIFPRIVVVIFVVQVVA